MIVFSNKDTRRLFLTIAVIMAAFLLLSQLAMWLMYKQLSLMLMLFALLAVCAVWAICFRYLYRQEQIMEEAVSQINAFLYGDKNARIDCNYEGGLYKLFHSVNLLATVLNAHAENELSSREFLKGTISDISHQLKTPLAALNIYNGLLQEETEALPSAREFVALSEQELDRIETLVQNLLKLTRLDSGSLLMEKHTENLADIMKDIELHFAYRAKQEQKEFILSGDESITLFCDRDWMNEAISNIVKNALDHTVAGNIIRIEWKQLANVTRITVTDNGSGIHPEDIHYVFKRFYRSRFSQDKKGIGLGLSLTKSIIEAHGGNISVDSTWGKGAEFVMSFLNTTKL